MHTASLAAILVAALAAAAHGQAAPAPCFEPNFGTLLGEADDQVFPAVALGFSFPFGGSTYTDIEVSSNGFAWLGNNQNQNPRCCSGIGAGLVADPPSIAPLWTDLLCFNPGGVYYNALPGRAVVTWKDVTEFGGSTRFTVQMQLVAGGFIVFWYHPATAIASHTALAGFSPGNGAPDPGSIDISASLPVYDTQAVPTFYEEWPSGTFDLPARTIEFVPNGVGGYLLLDRASCQFVPGSFVTQGIGCPPLSGNPNPEFYELLTGAGNDLSNFAFEMLPLGSRGYLVQASNAPWVTPTNSVPMFDDYVLQHPLPFAFPHPGGLTSVIGCCSNGFLWLDGANTGASFVPTTAALLSEGPRFCPYWTDLNPGAGGTTYADISPASALFTWDQVPEFGSSNANTFQTQLFPDGRIQVRYQSLLLTSTRNVLAGYSKGGARPDPGPTDLTAAIPFMVGTGTTPLVMDKAGGNPVIGANFTLQVTDLPMGSVAGFGILGLSPASAPLAGLGMPGCTQYESLDYAGYFPVSGPLATYSFPLPSSNVLLGLVAYTQAAIFAPGVNALGLATSNGGTLTIGTF